MTVLLEPLVVKEENRTYLDIAFNKHMSLKVNIKEASNELKGTFVSLISCVILVRKYTNLLFCLKTYKCCETWYNMTESFILSMERAHRFYIKCLQSLPLTLWIRKKLEFYSENPSLSKPVTDWYVIIIIERKIKEREECMWHQRHFDLFKRKYNNVNI